MKREEYRERLHNWWHPLTNDQKRLVPISKKHKTIDLRDLFSDVPEHYSHVRHNLKEDIEKIDEELKALGVLFDVEMYRERLNHWWQGLTDEQKKSVPIVRNSISLHELFSDPPVSYCYLRRNLKEDIKEIDTELNRLGVLFDVEVNRKRLVYWWQGLTDDQKRVVPTSGNCTIDLRDLFSDVQHSYYNVRRYLREDIKKIDAERMQLDALINVEVYRERLLNWWLGLTDAQKKSVPISKKNNTIDLRELFPQKYEQVRRHLKADIQKIDEELKILGVLFDIETYRDRLLNWWQSLTDEQKKMVSTSNNTIDLRDLFSDAPRSNYQVRRALREDIRKIDAELVLLGVLFIADDEVITTLMRDFISDCESNPVLLWDVEFSMHGIQNSNLVAEDPDSFFEQYGFISTTYLSHKLSCQANKLETPTLLALRKQLNKLLLKYEVSIPYGKIKGSSISVGADLNFRRIFLKWKNSLTDEEKLVLPMHGKSIAHKAFSHLIPTKTQVMKYPLFKAEFRSFSNEVLEIKGLDYKTKKERDEISRKKFLEKEESSTSKFYKLRDKTLVSINDFSSESVGFENVKHLFAVTSLKVNSKSSCSVYFKTFQYYCDLIESKGILPDSNVIDCFNSWSLRDFKDFLGEKISENTISTSTANANLSALRMTLNKLKTIRGINFNYYPADGFETVRESIAYKPYTPNERKQICEMLDQEMANVKRKLTSYQKLNRDNANLDDPKNQARVIFEDDCNCVPTYNAVWAEKDRTKEQNRLINFVSTRRLSLIELYDEWNVLTRRVTSREVGVYVLKMAQVLGMNLNSILDLELDDYQTHHPLTNKPCLTYWKERSTGEKMLHLDLFQADLQWLTMSQKKFVEVVFDEVQQLTSTFRKYAPDEISNRLFINFGSKCTRISETSMKRLYSNLIEEYQLKDDNGEPMVLTTTRFRPTLVSELVDAGISIREIQYLLGHASIYTTMKYLDQLDFDRVIRGKVRQAIEDIYTKAVHTTNQNCSQKQLRRFDESEIIMKTPLGGCKNIFDPPDFIKKSTLFVKGKPCSQYNKCLSCENVMLTERHLPELFALQRDYLASLENNVVTNTPYHVVVLENLSLLDDILNPETSEFEEGILTQAKEDSLFIETTIFDNWEC